MPVAAPVVISAVKTGTAPTNEQIVAALSTLHQDHGAPIGQPRILYTRGTPPQVKVEQVWGFTLDDPAGIVLTSFSVANLQQQMQTAFPGWQVKQARLATSADMRQTATSTIPVLIHTVATSALQSQAPSATDIQAGFERYSRSPLAENGHWVGPGPRIVRQSSTANNKTYAAWLYEWPDTPWVRANLVALVEGLQWAVNTGLREETQRRGAVFNETHLVPWEDVSATSWNESVNGPIAWWRDGHATHDSRTTTEFPGVGSTEYVENPIGPDTAATHPETVTNPFAGIQQSLAGATQELKVFGGIALGILGLWYLGPVIKSWGTKKTSQQQQPQYARRNPSLDVANTILAQMGGAGRLKAMIGAKDFMGGEYSLTFKWTAPALNKANALTVTLTTDDTYNMTFMSLRGRTVKVVRGVEGAHAEDLARIFRIETGLALSL